MRNRVGSLFYVHLVFLFMISVLPAQASFNKKNLRSHIQILASSDFQGRAPLTSGEKKAVGYLENQFRRIGLKPLPNQNSYLLPVPLAVIKSTVQGPIRFGNLELEAGEDISIESSDASSTLDVKEAEVVFVGYGINDPSRAWNDYREIDVKGKVVLIWVNDPGFRNPKLFRGKNMTYFGRWTYKLEEARRQGALGAFIIHEEGAAGYGWSVVGKKESHYDIAEAPQPGENSPLQFQGWIKESSLRKLFAASNYDYDETKNRALKPRNAFTQLSKSPFSVRMLNQITTGASHNVCGLLKGKTHPEKVILISAHWDHLGEKIRKDGTKEIYAGAIDNASGVAATLELGRYFHEHPTLASSLVLCSFTAEEQGLLGAKYFVAHPPFPLSNIKGVLNFDSLNVDEINLHVILSGGEEGGLGSLLSHVANKRGRKMIPDPMGEKGYFFRSDHYPFVLAGVKALNFLDIVFSNPDYLTHDYHQPTDVYRPTWTMNGLVEGLELFKDLVLQLDYPQGANHLTQ